jgi:hypothetical protein
VAVKCPCKPWRRTVKRQGETHTCTRQACARTHTQTRARKHANMRLCMCARVHACLRAGWDVDEGNKNGVGVDPALLISLTAPKQCARQFTGGLCARRTPACRRCVHSLTRTTLAYIPTVRAHVQGQAYITSAAASCHPLSETSTSSPCPLLRVCACMLACTLDPFRGLAACRGTREAAGLHICICQYVCWNVYAALCRAHASRRAQLIWTLPCHSCCTGTDMHVKIPPPAPSADTC